MTSTYINTSIITDAKSVGKGTYGRVYKYGINSVVKVQPLNQAFFREVLAMEYLDHPNVMKIQKFTTKRGMGYYKMEQADVCIADVDFSKYKLNGIISIAKQILCGLAHIHSNGLMHRDLREPNILITGNTVRIADFGMCRLSGQKGGTEVYSGHVSTEMDKPPEVKMSKEYTNKIDIWSVGIIILRMCTKENWKMYRYQLDEMKHEDCWLRIWNKLLGKIPKDISDDIQMKDMCLVPDGKYLVFDKEFNKYDSKSRLSDFIRYDLNEPLIKLALSMLNWDPTKRPTASECLEHECFASCIYKTPKNKIKKIGKIDSLTREERNRVVNYYTDLYEAMIMKQYRPELTVCTLLVFEKLVKSDTKCTHTNYLQAASAIVTSCMSTDPFNIGPSMMKKDWKEFDKIFTYIQPHIINTIKKIISYNTSFNKTYEILNYFVNNSPILTKMSQYL